MTTDITELAQSLKAAAENAIGAHERLAAYPYGEIIDISQHEGEQIDIDITDLNEFNKEANPENILALVEALASEKRICATWRKTAESTGEKLEKAQQQMTESENRVRKQNRHICELFDDNTALRQRIAELESRTVKLPQRHSMLLREDFNEDYHTEMAYKADEVQVSLIAAGIKVEAEFKVRSDDRMMYPPTCCHKHLETALQVHPFEQLMSYPPQPKMYCPECEPGVAEWAERDKQFRQGRR
ncbi:TPA: ead/Ea22-like family protein [Klebsiella pneumoniae]|nr:ead/Ea22-like family protein [Klebsiella pneumoniae]HBZ4229748.1 ead/Ea22-like family protein [Klebsiella pneumoniae]